MNRLEMVEDELERKKRQYSGKMNLGLKHLDSFLALLLIVFDWIFFPINRIRNFDYLIPEVFYF